MFYPSNKKSQLWYHQSLVVSSVGRQLISTRSLLPNPQVANRSAVHDREQVSSSSIADCCRGMTSVDTAAESCHGHVILGGWHSTGYTLRSSGISSFCLTSQCSLSSKTAGLMSPLGLSPQLCFLFWHCMKPWVFAFTSVCCKNRFLCLRVRTVPVGINIDI